MSDFYTIWTVSLFVALFSLFIGYILAIASLSDFIHHRNWKAEFEDELRKHYLY